MCHFYKSDFHIGVPQYYDLEALPTSTGLTRALDAPRFTAERKLGAGAGAGAGEKAGAGGNANYAYHGP